MGKENIADIIRFYPAKTTITEGFAGGVGTKINLQSIKRIKTPFEQIAKGSTKIIEPVTIERVDTRLGVPLKRMKINTKLEPTIKSPIEEPIKPLTKKDYQNILKKEISAANRLQEIRETQSQYNAIRFAEQRYGLPEGYGIEGTTPIGDTQVLRKPTEKTMLSMAKELKLQPVITPKKRIVQAPREFIEIKPMKAQVPAVSMALKQSPLYNIKEIQNTRDMMSIREVVKTSEAIKPREVLKNESYKIIAVDDGSFDNSLRLLKELKGEKRIKVEGRTKAGRWFAV